MTQHKKELEKIQQSACHFFPKGGFIAGGALTAAFTGTEINDVDIYFKTKADFIEAVQCAYDERLWCVFASDRAVTFAYENKLIQLMHFDFFETPEAIFDAFDFTICMAAFDIDKQDFVFHEDFLKHASQRYLKFHSGTRYPHNSLLRVLKYQARGYSIGRSDMLRIALACQKVTIDSWDALADAIGGQYGEKALIQAETPFSLDAAMDLYKDIEITTNGPSEEMPGNAYDLLIKVGFKEEELTEVEKPSKSWWR